MPRSALDPARGSLKEAIAYWERRRIGYNAALVVLGLAWGVLTWPHFQPALKLESLGRLLVLAALANLCYCAAYPLELAFGGSAFGAAWRRLRGLVWIAGTLFAVVLACYWIADEIYPFVN